MPRSLLFAFDDSLRCPIVLAPAPDRPNEPPRPDDPSRPDDDDTDDVPDVPPTEPPPAPIRDPRPGGQPPGPYVTRV